MQKVIIKAVVLAAGLAMSGEAPAAPGQLGNITIIGSNETGTRDCAGATASIVGNNHQLTLKNCQQVGVLGNNNILTLVGTQTLEVPGNNNQVRAGQVRSISTLGNGNTVTYRKGPKGETPTVSNLGSRNSVKHE